jgi:tetratricopeptide (TPR) repeat protein
MSLKDSDLPTAQEIEKQLERIIRSKRFRRASTSVKLLKLMAAYTLKNKKLTENIVGIRVFDRRKGWAPLLDSIVRTGRHNLQTYLAEYYGSAGVDDPVIIEAPEGGNYRVLCLYNPQSLANQSYLNGVNKLDDMFFTGNPISAEPDFTQAIARDPLHARAVLGRAEHHLIRLLFWNSPFDDLEKAEADAAAVLRLDERLMRAHLILAVIHCTRGKWPEAALAFECWKKHTLPEGRDLLWYAMFLLANGRQKEAFSLIQSSAANVSDATSQTIQGFLLYLARRFNLAEDCLLRAHRTRQDAGKRNHFAVLLAACVCLEQDRAGEAMILFRECRTKWFVDGFFALSFARMGDMDLARKLTVAMQYQSPRNYVPPLQLSLAHMALGETSQAIRFLETAYLDGDPWVMCIRHWPLFDPLRQDKQFKMLLKRMHRVTA